MSPEFLAGLSGLFASAFVAATLFPVASEAVLVGLLLATPDQVWLLVIVATAGNVLGSVVNWVIGRFLIRFQDRKWFPVSPRLMVKAPRWYQRWGYWSLLLAWTPFIGDPLTVAAGVLRANFWIFVGIVTISKAGRYLVLAGTALHWMGP